MIILYVLLDEKNRGDFQNVFSDDIPEEGNRVSLGAYRPDGAVLGAVSYALNNYQFDIDWLYVAPEARCLGVGSGLLHEIEKIMTDTGERYPLSARFVVSNDQTALHRFFLSLSGADVSYSHERYFVKAGDLQAAKPLFQKTEMRFQSEYFFDRPIDWQERTLAMLARTQDLSVMDYESWKKECAPELCRCLMIQDELVGLIFVRKDKRDLELSWLYCNHPTGLFSLLTDVAADANRYFPKAALTFDAINERSDQLARRFFPNAQHMHIYEAWW